MSAPFEAPPGMILAGGLSRRMGGGDKGLRDLSGRPLLAHVIARMAPQLPALALNANGDPARFAPLGLKVVPDPLPGHPGPLAGVLAAMGWAQARGAPWVVTVPGDTPWLPGDLVPRLILASEDSDGIALAECGGRLHPVCGLWPVRLRATLERDIAAGARRIGDWAQRHGAARAAFAEGTPDPFANLNTPEDFARAEARR
ncbi:molybdenum cofactor guanylyltransferase MobA [Limimaricola cinnabarinus]|jgi:molybdopterin-guanine dinucleotide biosynthesis protein A|uniref:Molybdenum cofactor guanylyltransferase n=1 Tax=Limimaricola cinnabarinus TaxID=1125964 RepID=A0A2G1MGK8_9RHOB|nr:molybdenum cofactor guanylyltransferase MobA [Limimaricola cinnabarinus]PHP27802.1 molybdenum cofactor guanylyltransferase MobA [Limimaricola cinnabarinus]